MRAECLDGIGHALLRLSGLGVARPYLESALESFTAMGHRRADDVSADLARLPDAA